MADCQSYLSYKVLCKFAENLDTVDLPENAIF